MYSSIISLVVPYVPALLDIISFAFDGFSNVKSVGRLRLEQSCFNVSTDRLQYENDQESEEKSIHSGGLKNHQISRSNSINSKPKSKLLWRSHTIFQNV